VARASDTACPVLLLQGLDDPIVSPPQSERFAEAVARKDIPYAYLAFEGESHGFRRAETVKACLEAELAFYGQTLGFDPKDVPAVSLTVGQPPPRRTPPPSAQPAPAAAPAQAQPSGPQAGGPAQPGGGQPGSGPTA
jgi:acetyl esterase/lipase